MVEYGTIQTPTTETEETVKRLPLSRPLAAFLSAAAFIGIAAEAAEAVPDAPFKVTSSKPQRDSHLTERIPTPLPHILRRIGGCESNGNAQAPIDYKAVSKISTASGGFQFLDTTWNHFKGYSRAIYAPPRIQNWRAKIELKKNGTSPWTESQHCWG